MSPNGKAAVVVAPENSVESHVGVEPAHAVCVVRILNNFLFKTLVGFYCLQCNWKSMSCAQLDYGANLFRKNNIEFSPPDEC